MRCARIVQVLADYNDAGVLQRWFVYGNYIDEALMMVAACLEQGAFAHRLYYIQDGLYSTRALVADKGWVIEEQTYYDVYGRARTWTSGDADADGDIDGDDRDEFSASFFGSECDAGYNWRCDVDNSGSVDTTDWPAFRRSGSTPANQQSYFTNPYYFTGRRVDFLDDGNLKLQLNRHRYYDYYTGRWLTQDPLGMKPFPQRANKSDLLKQYSDTLNLYEYAVSSPINYVDGYGLDCKFDGYSVVIWMATPIGKKPANILTTKKTIKSLWWLTLGAGMSGKVWPLNVAYAIGTKTSSWGFITGALQAHMHFCGSHLYGYVCEWACITVTKGIIKKKKIKKPVFVGCYWHQCIKKKGCKKGATWSPCDCDIYTYPIGRGDNNKCSKDIADMYKIPPVRKLHLLTVKDLKKIKTELGI